MKKIVLFVVFFLSFSLKSTVTILESADLPTIKDDLFKQFFLVVYPEAGFDLNLKYEEEMKWVENHAMVIIDSETGLNTLRIGDPFFIVKNESKIAEATLIKFFSSYRYGPVGLLRLKEKIDWAMPGNGDALAFAKKKPAPDTIGSVTYLDEKSQKKHLSWIEPYIPKHYGNIRIVNVARVIPPRSPEEYILINAEYYETKEKYESDQNNDWKTEYQSIGFLFHQKAKKMVLLEKVDGLSNIDGITDINRDGIYEVLVFTDSTGSEMRLFDGKALSESKRFMGDGRD